MKAAVIRPKQAGSIHLEDIPRPEPGPGEVRVRVLEVGIDGTDLDINQGAYGEAPAGRLFLVAAHESVGVVEALGPGAEGLSVGELVVATVRRPCPELCANCAAGRVDFCTTGHFLERGIKGLDGYAAPYYVESPRYLIRVPEALRAQAVFLEPLSVAEKAWRQAELIQRRLVWEPQRALVVGAGSLGLLMAMVLRLRGLETYVYNRGEATRPKARRAEELGATWIDADGEPIGALASRVGEFDLVVECTGVPRLLFDGHGALATNGVIVNLGLSMGDKRDILPAASLSRNMVLRNQLMVGSVNAGHEDFLRGVEDLAAAEAAYPGWLGRLVSRRVPLAQLAQAFREAPEDIKVVLEMSDDERSEA